ncbi:hypothetical protein F5Y15DRAFT_409710 [Xylariaceae sp. FL0016]|nr:hypothetical protein F5Y15DRAFT_409710 [Xylariaceae sp. FL0016]
MSCEICQRQHHPKRLPFLCAVDARNELYEGRIANARVLIEMEELESRVNKLLSDSGPASSSRTAERSTRIYMENCASEEQKAKDRTEKIMASADKLRDEVAAAKREFEERKSSVARRKSDLAAASQGVPARRNRELEEARKIIKMTKYTWDREYEAMAQYRTALCMEVAKLYRLQRLRRGNPARFDYKIGGIDMIDLQNMNNAQPEVISASLAHIAHLLWLASHYLAIRLPAEITLPHNDYPRPTIFSLSSSYHHGEVAFPGSSPLPPDPRDRQFANVPFPRPLYLDRPLATLAKDDPATYNAFLEAVCLLAYNVVWLCRAQGVQVGENSDNFNDFASLGRNLYNLLINSSPLRNPQQIADGTVHHGTATGRDDIADLGKTGPRMGWYSHGTAHTFLGGASGNDLTRSFKLPKPAQLIDKLKSKLNRESDTAPEWEVLDDDAWAPDDPDDGVLVGGTRPKTKAGERGARFGHESFMSVNTVKSGGSGDGSRVPSAGVGKDLEKDKEKSSNGWTKIKPR